ncbi:MAG: hypothetical protein JNM81_17700 [Rhodospirillaceae bacterium]|nr:hypothetical protein [Rhodospirillaceae bacterium]
MKRLIRWIVIVVVAISVLSVGGLWLQRDARYAPASAEAIAATVADADVEVTAGDNLTLRPRHDPKPLGVVFYPGAYTDLRGYIPTLRPLAVAGYRVVIVHMPFDLAILGTGRASDAMAANPDITHWVIMGHSVGGAAAGVFAYQNPGAVDGVVIWDSFPPSFTSLAAFPKPVWHIHRAKPDGAPPDSFLKQREFFPASSTWVPIPGGIHMNFGSFMGGGYQEDWAPSISQSEQHALVVAATLRALDSIAQPLLNPTPPPAPPDGT